MKEINKNWGDMYCPLCASLLTIYDLVNEEEEVEPPWGNRLECVCPKGCFGEDFPLYLHHPFRGTESAPGDSWSLSWVK